MSENGTATMCCERVVSGSNGWRSTYKNCSRAAVVERHGKPYCRQHDPDAAAARRQATLDRYDAEARGWAKAARIAVAEREVVAAARRAAKQAASWDDVAEAVAKLEALQ